MNMRQDKYNYAEIGLSLESYLGIEGYINSGAIKAGKKSMKHMNFSMESDHTIKPTTSMRMGKLIHGCTLENNAHHLCIWEGKQRRGKAWENWCKENEAEWSVNHKEYDELLYISEQFHAIPGVEDLLKDADPEVSLFWRTPEYGNAKSRLDLLGPKGIVEHKTTTRIDPRAFISQAFHLGYHLQLGWQATGMINVFDSILPPAHVIVQENAPPFDGYLLVVPPMLLEFCMEEAALIAQRYRECEKTGEYPGVLPEMGQYELPIYAQYDESWVL